MTHIVLPRGQAEQPRPCATAFDSIALVLQGGGALGSYQAGVYEALTEHGIQPSWIAGVSIGAINAAIIAGNSVGQAVAKLRAFWEGVSNPGDSGWSDGWSRMWRGDAARALIGRVEASRVMTHGVDGFFSPRIPPPYLLAAGQAGATSWYDTASLRTTLERLIDFDRINAGAMRFSIGAVNVRTGNFAYFDNTTHVIKPEHIMASGALPPALPAVELDGEFYWDGGLVSNTPLEWVLSTPSHVDTLVLQVDLWSARGVLPRDLAEVATRMKETQYSSRTRAATDEFRTIQAMRAAFHRLHAQLPDMLRETPEAKLLAEASNPAVYNIVQLIYRSPAYEGQAKDYEFSRRTMEEHWAKGHQDATAALAHPEVLIPPAAANTVQTFDFGNG